MENLVQEYQFEYTCTDDPDELLLIMCGDEWGARECQVARDVLRKEWNRKLFGKSTINNHSISLVFLSLIIGFFCQISSNFN